MSEDDSDTSSIDIIREQLQKKDRRIEQLTNEVTELRLILEEGTKLAEPPSNDELEEQYLEWKDRSETTQNVDESVFRRVRIHTGDKHWREVSKEDIRSWISSLDIKATSGYDYLSRLSALFDWMETKEWAEDINPAKEARTHYQKRHQAELQRTGTNTGTVVEPEIYSELVESTYNKRSRAILTLGVKTGLRRKQLALLERDDVDLTEKILLDRYPKGMGLNRLDDSRADMHLFDAETASILETWLDKRDRERPNNDWLFPGRDEGEHLSISQFGNVFNKTTERAAHLQDDKEIAAQFRQLTSHDMRRCFTSWLNWNNCPRDIIAGLRADADVDMVALYTEYGPERVREEYEDAMPLLGLHR